MKKTFLLPLVFIASLFLLVTGVYAAEIDWSLYPYSIYKSEFENAELYVEKKDGLFPILLLLKKGDNQDETKSGLIIEPYVNYKSENGVVISKFSFKTIDGIPQDYSVYESVFYGKSIKESIIPYFSECQISTFSDREAVFISHQEYWDIETVFQRKSSKALSYSELKEDLSGEWYDDFWETDLTSYLMTVEKQPDTDDYKVHIVEYFSYDGFNYYPDYVSSIYRLYDFTAQYNYETDVYEFSDCVKTSLFSGSGNHLKYNAEILYENGLGYMKYDNGQLILYSDDIFYGMPLIFQYSGKTEYHTVSEGLNNFKKTRSYKQGQFRDVQPSTWYSKSVKYAYELGLVNGSGEATFSPNGTLTVTEAVALACRIHSLYYTGKADFVQGTPWYQVYLDYAISNNLLYYSYWSYIAFDGYSYLQSSINRSDFAELLSKALPKSAMKSINSVEYGSIPDVSSWNKAVYALYNAGIITGNDSRGTFNPDGEIKRSEVATIITRMADENERKRISLPLSQEGVGYSGNWKDKINDYSVNVYKDEKNKNAYLFSITLLTPGNVGFVYKRFEINTIYDEKTSTFNYTDYTCTSYDCDGFEYGSSENEYSAQGPYYNNSYYNSPGYFKYENGALKWHHNGAIYPPAIFTR